MEKSSQYTIFYVPPEADLIDPAFNIIKGHRFILIRGQETLRKYLGLHLNIPSSVPILIDDQGELYSIDQILLNLLLDMSEYRADITIEEFLENLVDPDEELISLDDDKVQSWDLV